jgi:hypothetical protein
MANTQTLIAQAYSAFNRRDIDSALALMSENLAGPRHRKAGVSSGKKRFDPTGPVSGRSLILTWNPLR